MSLLLHTACEKGEKGPWIDALDADVVLFVSLAARAVAHAVAATLRRHPVRLAIDTSIGEVRDMFAEGPLQLAHCVSEEHL